MPYLVCIPESFSLYSRTECRHAATQGHGVEYSWGCAKLFFRRNNDLVPAHFHQNVRAALAQVTRRRVMMFDRRARTYRCVEKDTALDNFGLLEKAVKLRKAHRNAVDFDSGWIKAACLASEEDLPGEQTLEQLMALHRPATVAWSRPSGPEAHDTGATAVAGASADAADRTFAAGRVDDTDDVVKMVAES